MFPRFDESTALVERVAGAIHGNRRVVFLLGSGAAMPRDDAPGVPSATGIVAMIRARLRDALPDVVSYQEAFRILIAKQGQDAANEVIKDAVLQAQMRDAPAVGANPTWRTLVKLEERPDDWAINDGIAGIAALIAHHPRKFGEVILTTNFDPLIEIALTRAKVPWHSTSLHSDGSLLYLRGSGSGVVHLHGYWWGSDTLNTTVQLTAGRPQLGASLGHILSNSLLVVLGYGGWEDIMMRALSDVLSANDPDRCVDVLWAFHSNDEDAIIEGSKTVLNTLEAAYTRGRAHFYRGVDIDEFGVALFRHVVADAPAERLSLFFERMYAARTQPSIYRKLASPWGCTSGGVIGEYVKKLAKFNLNLPPAAALVLVELQLPLLELQPVHQAPSPQQFQWVRPSLRDAWSAMEKSAVSDQELIAIEGLAICARNEADAIKYVPGGSLYETLLCAAAFAFEAVVALRRGQTDVSEYLSASSAHALSRSLYDNEIHVAAHLAARLNGMF